MTPTDYEFCCRFLMDRSGLYLGPDKLYLLEGRLQPVARAHGLDGLATLIAQLRRAPNSLIADEVIEAMTTNETLFFRDRTPFDELKSVLLPALIERRKDAQRLRIWSAAASTGQEAYSLAMLLEDNFPQLSNWQIEILGTDLSAAALQRAKAGVYSQFEVQRGLPIQMLVKHFQQTPAGWQIQDHLKKRVKFQTLNLLKPFREVGTFDIIFCRNVLIYFESQLKREILERMVAQLRPDGCLVLGAAETVIGVTDCLERDRNCKAPIYIPKSPVAVQAAF